jgi:hypothetical protein
MTPRPAHPTPANPACQQMAQRYVQVRAQTESLAAPLSEADCQVQSMPDASPTKWHLAHVTWFFETFVLERFEPGFQPFHPAFRVLFNSYYHGRGRAAPAPAAWPDHAARPERGTRLPRAGGRSRGPPAGWQRRRRPALRRC